MEDDAVSVTRTARVVSNEVYLTAYDAPRWCKITVDLDAGDEAWIIKNLDRRSARNAAYRRFTTFLRKFAFWRC